MKDKFNRLKFNSFCAEVMGIDIDEDFVAEEITEDGGFCYEYNPHDDLNQMAEVVEKLAKQQWEAEEITPELSAYRFWKTGIKQAMRDFIISTMPEEEHENVR